MSSEDVAKYLYEVGGNQRKLQYCRQILTSNTNFIPQCVFNLRDPMNTNSQTKSQFIENLKSLSLGCNSQEETLIFNYFQIDSKNYITFGQFQDLVIPQKDQALKKLVAMRRKEEFCLDYSLKFALQKFYFQIIQNQVKLELMCKFTFPKANEDHKLKNKRLDDTSLSQFMAAHGKYPDAKTLQYIVREINLNKGDCKRNKLITEYIITFNQKYKRKGQPLPQILAKEPLAITTSTRKQSFQPSKENYSAANNYQGVDISLSKPERNPLLTYNPLQKLSTPISQRKGTGVFDPISQVEKRINSLMSEVNSSLKNNSNNSPIKQMYKKCSGKEQQLQSSIVETIKDQVKREKNKQAQSIISKNDSKEAIDLRLKSQIKRNNFAGKLSKIDDIQYDALTEKSPTDRILDNLPRKKTAEEQDIASHSQLIQRPSRFGSPPKLGSNSMVRKYDYRVADKSKREDKPEGVYKKRIEYLKSLIDDKGSCLKVVV